jgi:hypothetical protein
MDKAQLILYGVATYLAIKSLVTLMGQHRQTYKKKLAQELKAAVPPAAPDGVAGQKGGPPVKKKGAVTQPAVAKAAPVPKTPVKPPAKPAVNTPANPAVTPAATPEAAAKKAG